MSDTPSRPTPQEAQRRDDAVVAAIFDTVEGSDDGISFSLAMFDAALLARGLEIVRSEDRRDEAIVREVLSGPLGYSTGANDEVVRITADDNGGFDCDVQTATCICDGNATTRWAALVAACREVQS